MIYENLCDKIFDIDSQIRFVAVFSSYSGKLAGGMRKGLETLTPESVTALSVEQSFLRWSTRMEMSEWIGSPKYALAEYEKLKRFTFPISKDILLLVTTEIGISNDVLISEIKKLI